MAADRILTTSIAQEVPLGPLLTLDDIAAIRCPVLSILGSNGYQADDLDALTSLLPNGEVHVSTARATRCWWSSTRTSASWSCAGRTAAA